MNLEKFLLLIKYKMAQFLKLETQLLTFVLHKQKAEMTTECKSNKIHTFVSAVTLILEIYCFCPVNTQ